MADLLSRRINYISIIPREIKEECSLSNENELVYNIIKAQENLDNITFKEIKGNDGNQLANSIFQEWYINKEHQNFGKMKDDVHIFIFNRQLTIHIAKCLVKRLGLLIRNCNKCIQHNVLKRKSRAKTTTIQPFQLLYLDVCYISNLPIIIGVDAYSRHL